MRHFKDDISWKRHISEWIPEYVAKMTTGTSIRCHILYACGSSFGESYGTILEISTALASQIQRRNANARTMIAKSKLYCATKGNGLGFKPIGR
jgi:hypothetical protein